MRSSLACGIRSFPFVGLLRIAALGAVTAMGAVQGATADGPTLVSAAVDGGAPDGPSVLGDLTADGALVVFTSSATDLLAAGATVPAIGVYVRDQRHGHTTLLTPEPCGQPRITPDGATVVAIAPSGELFASPFEVVRIARSTGAVETISVAPDGSIADSDCITPQISDDGQVIAYDSDAGNLTGSIIPGGNSDIFVVDLRRQQTTCISRDRAGHPGTGACTLLALSGNGRYVAFASTSPTLPFAGGPGGLYIVDRERGTTTRIDRAPQGDPADGIVGTNGAFTASGEVLVFSSTATNLVRGPHRCVPVEDVFRFDRAQGAITRVSATPDGGFPDQGSFAPAVARDGTVITYLSYAQNLTPAHNGHGQAYAVVRDHPPVLLSAGPDGTPADADCWDTTMVSRDGHTCLFATEATRLVPGDTSGELQVYGAHIRAAREPSHDDDRCTLPHARN